MKNNEYPINPYAPPVQGAFHNQSPLDKTVPGKYTVYIPGTFEPCSPAIIILTPDGISAESFYGSDRGADWITVADTHGTALVIAEPYEAGNWNLSNSPTARFDEIFLYEVWNTINKKFASIAAAFDLDERALYWVGYEEGGSAVHKMALLWPQLFAGLVSINGKDVSSDIIDIFGGQASFPFEQSQNTDGKQTIGLPNNKIPVPVWMISAESGSGNDGLKEHWISADNAAYSGSNEYANECYANEAARVWITRGRVITEEIIYSEFLYPVQRFDFIPGGELKWRIPLVNNGTTGFFFTETMVDGFLRRWWTYIPASYDSGNAYPLIIGMHGGSNDAAAFIGDSRWNDAADAYGLIVVFPMAYPCPLPAMDWIPVPIWNQYTVSPSNAPDDVAFIQNIIKITKQKYSIDDKKIFATGHSNGAGMTWRLGLDVPEDFTAISPSGYTMGSIPDKAMPDPVLKNPLPTWVFMGRYDALNADAFFEGNWNDLCVSYWSNRDSFISDIHKTAYDGKRYFTRTWTNGVDDIPIFRYSSVADCPHIYQPEECNMLWEMYFSKITKDASGSRFFEGQKIIAGNTVKWTAFQGNANNNGVFEAGYNLTRKYVSEMTAPISSNTVYGDIGGEALTYEKDGKAYIFVQYSTPTDGIHMKAYAVNEPEIMLWDRQLYKGIGASDQLSTPIIVEDTQYGDTIYAASTQYNNVFGTFSYPMTVAAGSSNTLDMRNVNLVGQYHVLKISTELVSLKPNDYLAEVVLTSGSNTYEFGVSSGEGEFVITLNTEETESKEVIFSGRYTVTVTLHNNTGENVSANIQILIPNWELCRIRNITGNPTVTRLLTSSGRADTPLKQFDDAVYFGTYDAYGCYFKFSMGKYELSRCNPESGDSFYWAGVTELEVNGKDCLICGSELGNIYLMDKNDSFSSSGGNPVKTISLNDYVDQAGGVRSSICKWNGYVFFTSRNGYLWRAEISSLMDEKPNLEFVQLSGNSVSTPVVAGNYCFVGFYSEHDGSESKGGIDVITVTGGTFQKTNTLQNSVPVYSSPVVSWENETYYVFYTTYGTMGKGFCYQYKDNGFTKVWEKDVDYALQGMSAGVGFIAYADKGNKLHVIR